MLGLFVAPQSESYFGFRIGVSKVMPALTDAAFKQASWDWVQDAVAARTKWGGIEAWDVSNVTDFSYAFSTQRVEEGGYGGGAAQGAYGTNPKAASLKLTPACKRLSSSFSVGPACVSLAGTISKWDTSSVTSLVNTFKGATSLGSFSGDYNTPVDFGGWDVSRVTNMGGTFYYATRFTGTGLDKWKTTSVTNLGGMFGRATSMNTNLGGWDTSRVTNMDKIFWLASAFKGDGVAGWTTTSVTSVKLGCLPWCKRAVKEGGEVESNEVARICNTCKAGAFELSSAFGSHNGVPAGGSNGGVLLVGGTCQAWCSPAGSDGLRRCGTGSTYKTSGSTDCRSDGVTDGDTSPATAIAAVVIVVVLLIIAV